MSQLQEAIKKTIEYGSKFGVKYTRHDIEERLISKRVFSEKDIKRALKKFPILDNQFINNYNEEKIKKAVNLVELIGKYFNNILLITITGSVAAGYPNRNDDIDLMIVTKENTLWLTRLELRLFIWWHKIPHRVYGNKEIRDQFCFNLWLEDNSLRVPKNKQSLQNAMDSILMIPVLNRYQTYEKFFRENVWIKRFVASGYKNITSNFSHKDFLRSQLQIPKREIFRMPKKTNWLIKLVNWAVFWPQWWYMKNKISKETIGFHEAYFHPKTQKPFFTIN